MDEERADWRRSFRASRRADFARETVQVARALIGAVLVHETHAGVTAGRIVETEAYLAVDDPASHSHRGPTLRNASMFSDPGRAYVYTSYGVHACFNVVTARRGIGEAVLVRALEPIEGLQLMRERRGGAPDRNLCRGPGNLCVALGISREHDGCALSHFRSALARSELRILWPRRAVAVSDIASGPRVGISRATDLPLRFALSESPWISRPRLGLRSDRPRTRGSQSA